MLVSASELSTLDISILFKVIELEDFKKRVEFFFFFKDMRCETTP